MEKLSSLPSTRPFPYLPLTHITFHISFFYSIKDYLKPFKASGLNLKCVQAVKETRGIFFTLRIFTEIFCHRICEKTRIVKIKYQKKNSRFFFKLLTIFKRLTVSFLIFVPFSIKIQLKSTFMITVGNQFNPCP